MDTQKNSLMFETIGHALDLLSHQYEALCLNFFRCNGLLPQIKCGTLECASCVCTSNDLNTLLAFVRMQFEWALHRKFKRTASEVVFFRLRDELDHSPALTAEECRDRIQSHLLVTACLFDSAMRDLQRKEELTKEHCEKVATLKAKRAAVWKVVCTTKQKRIKPHIKPIAELVQ